ncbi:hypothetical protein [Kineococcus terrestris]|uniref:hypothetical protein n=1 Tax=Kineococcus terrestris TaxID=2044856 RepID=UPI0034DAC5EC
MARFRVTVLGHRPASPALGGAAVFETVSLRAPDAAAARDLAVRGVERAAGRAAAGAPPVAVDSVSVERLRFGRAPVLVADR